jgi:transcriptional regulator with XRE-family HTH domain
MNTLVNLTNAHHPDIEVLEEAALAMAQSVIQNAMTESGIKQSEVARRMERDRSFVSRMLSGNHNLTIKTMARSLAACGFEVRFERVPITSNWIEAPASITRKETARPRGQYYPSLIRRLA